MSEGGRVIENHGEWDWSLVVTESGIVAARKPIKHDGVLTFSTADRRVPDRARSQARLTVDEVIHQYVTRSSSDTPAVELLDDVVAALEDVRGVTEGDDDAR
ncbi:hypothetical protein [Halorientalis regularis]|uniref:Uncharacterized protein n=1 Tax=Halorientalis regularis TaxID=660518 RepID=A0A1G7UBT6_9EURY|nr:hypothetical protein [Halorientalis regularis]SDG44499.1 hypothetical protein SAMN05216218_1464 [Halorientalis regularis]